MAQKTFVIFGLQRSGNHAIIRWLCALFDNARHINDLPHDSVVFSQSMPLADFNVGADIDALVLSLEDSADKLGRQNSFKNSLETTLDSLKKSPSLDIQCLVVLRDPYNTLASRLMAHRKRGLTSSPIVSDFLDNWKFLARKCVQKKTEYILYNAWKTSTSYRQEVFQRVGGHHYTTKTMSEIPKSGGGSSFDGRGRMSPSEILEAVSKHNLGSIFRMIWRRPKLVATRLFGSRLQAQELQTDSRWELFRDDPEWKAILDDPDIAELSRNLFGFYISPETGRIDS